MFTQNFRNYVCEGDSISCEVDGFTCVATLYRDDDNSAPDKRQDGFWPSLDPKDDGWIGPKSKRTLGRHMARAKAFYKQWEGGELCYCGVVVTIEREDVQLVRRYDHALWGVDCNYDLGRKTINSYLRDVANELLPEALADAREKISKLAAA